ncbi:hypothetical protein M413DRAFT_20009 [Hebeloma cylindrosporum]|uniref:Integrase core domain-containing protein n=1 Tax=Hebeloma cylindrosporum TaxID=76867 RepID=A0A0C3C4K4_HEBCY|nr:hypothetical protein M413DRAFT_20009 [Hebeloma cylindrosporum h7]
MRKTDIEIINLLQEKHIDLTKYSLGLTNFRKMRAEMGLTRTRQQAHTPESILPHMQWLRPQYKLAGAREMVNLLFHKRGISVSRHVVVRYFKRYEKELMRARKSGRLRRRRFWAAGVNDILAVDQHDKWKRFGFALHNGIDPFCGKIRWMKVWWTNSNPKLILSYYLEMIENTKGMPLVTQSDPGSENYGIANAQTVLRHWHDPSLVGSIQHRWMRQKKNVMPEIAWSQLRRRFTPGFEDKLELGVTNNWYDVNNPLHVLVFRWIFIPWIQLELDGYVSMVNNSRKRADRNKILPHGVPNDIDESPERFGALDFKITVEPEAIQYVRELFAPPSDPTFELVPAAFALYADMFYKGLGSPEISWDTAWDIYQDMLFQFEQMDAIEDIVEEWETQVNLMDEDPPAMPLIEGQRDLLGGEDVIDEDGSYYMGGVNNGQGLDAGHHQSLDDLDEDPEEFEIDVAAFSDEENLPLADDVDMNEW